MTQAHLSTELLERFARGTGTKDENLKAIRHLSAGCVECRRAVAAASDLRASAAAPSAPPELDQAAIDRILKRVRERESQLGVERAEAPVHLQELLRHPAAQRATLVRNLKRFQTWGWCELLVSESYSLRFSDAAEGVALAELAVLAASCLDAPRYGEALVADMRGLACAHLANALRVASDLLGAEKAMRQAEIWMKQGTGDFLHEARLFEMKTNLRAAQRRFPEALRASKRAETRYGMARDQHKVGSVLLERAVVYTKMGEAGQAEELLRQSLELLDSRRDPRLPLMAKAILAHCFTMAGRFGEAEQALRGLHAAFSRLGDRLTSLRMRWLEANAASGQEDSRRAELLLREVRSGFLAEEIPYDVALVSLDLAALYLTQGRTAEVKAIAQEIAAVFLALQVQREAYAAAILFQQAVEAETASVGLIKKLAQYLREVQLNPHLAFQE